MADRQPMHDPIRARAIRLRQILTLVCAGVAVLLVSERLGYAGVYRGDATAAAIAAEMLLSLPAILYLAAVWKLRQAVAEGARGDLFGHVACSALRGVGILLIAGSIATLFVMPLVAATLGRPEERLIEADVATLILAMVGLGQIFLAGLMQRAGLAERELAEFF